jgi:hypothetical protein
MALSIRSALVVLLLGGAALLIGLTGTTLRTGWIDPLDWLLPGAAAIIMLLLIASRGGHRPRAARIARLWAVIVVPIALFCLIAGTRQPWVATVLLGLGLALVACAASFALRLAPVGRWLAIAALLGAAMIAPRFAETWRGSVGAGGKPVIGVMTAMPLQGVAMGTANGLAPVEAIGMRSPLWQALESRFRPRPLDALDPASLQGLRVLLLAQPRALAPTELVALDGWVRRGGRAVILADPLLHWPDPRPLGHPARAPLTSLLDPLLSHWGLRLEPAEMDVGRDPLDRRALAGGAMLQLSGASRFTPLGRSAGCTVQEHGPLATCRIGQGRALLVADADWINDTLWTLDPAHPDDRRAWTSDAVILLESWLRGEAPRLTGLGTWLVDEGKLIESLRFSFVVLLLLVMADWFVARRPMAARHADDTKADHIWNISETNLDTT